jgi:hypothetical protein
MRLTDLPPKCDVQFLPCGVDLPMLQAEWPLRDVSGQILLSCSSCTICLGNYGNRVLTTLRQTIYDLSSHPADRTQNRTNLQRVTVSMTFAMIS